jgi:hypothetical protein
MRNVLVSTAAPASLTSDHSQSPQLVTKAAGLDEPASTCSVVLTGTGSTSNGYLYAVRLETEQMALMLAISQLGAGPLLHPASKHLLPLPRLL